MKYSTKTIAQAEAIYNSNKPLHGENFRALPYAVRTYINYLVSLAMYNRRLPLLHNCVHIKTSWRKGYMCRTQAPYIGEYKGRYGTGYIVAKPAYSTTRYHIVEYWINQSK